MGFLRSLFVAVTVASVTVAGVPAQAAGNPVATSIGASTTEVSGASKGSQRNVLAAATGELDRRFGVGGKVTTDFAGDFDEANALVVQSGKLVAAGSAGIAPGSGTTDFGLARYNRNGTLDTSFGSGGKVTTDFLEDSDQGNALVVQAGGKLVAAGAAFTGGGQNPDFALARYNRDGTLDTSFGTDGKVTTEFGGDDVAKALVVQPDGKLVAAGFSSTNISSDFALARYNGDGTLDTSFGTGGTVITDLAGSLDQANALVVQPDGKLVAAGFTSTNIGSDFALARYNRDGSLDTGFGTGGMVTTDFAGAVDQAHGLVVQDGRLVAAGSTFTEFTADFALARYNRDGTLDTSFGTGGMVTTDFAGGLDQANALVVRGGRLVAAGFTTAVGFDLALARYNRDGTLDTGFGTGGMVTTDFAGSFDQANALAWQANSVVAAGVAFTGSATDFALARYRMSG